MDDQLDIQTWYLGALREGRIPTSVYLKSGIRLQGTVTDFDRYTIFLKNVTVQVVYKHAISTIVPSRELPSSRGREDDA